jgi:pimeloyl-ACP methyl ester carboxylesterase
MLLGNAGAIFADFDSGWGDHVPEERLAGIEIPTTIVDCKLSPAFLRRSCERLRRLMPQARTVTLEQSGHHIGVDARAELVALLCEVVAKRERASTPVTAS